MNNKVWLSLIFSVSFLFSKNQFMGIIEDGSVNKNKFLCPLSLNASGNVLCNDMDAPMIGFDFSIGGTVQIFNNQQYWLQQKSERNYLLQVQGYKDDRLDSAMTSEGWDHMGAFSIIISADPILAQAIEPEKVAEKGEIKLIVQLWYSAKAGLQLWAQDVQLLKSGQNFKILVSNASSKAFAKSSSVNPDPLSGSKSLDSVVLKEVVLPSLTNTETTKVAAGTSQQAIPTTLQNFKQQFLKEVGFAPSFIQKDVYNAAYGSPRNIQIQVQ